MNTDKKDKFWGMIAILILSVIGLAAAAYGCWFTYTNENDKIFGWFCVALGLISLTTAVVTLQNERKANRRG